MSKFVALWLVGAQAATVAIHEHFANEADPFSFLESMRALAKKAQEGKIDPATLAFVANLTSTMRAKVDDGIACAAADEEKIAINCLGTLTELNNKLASDESDQESEKVEIESNRKVVEDCREVEEEWDGHRCADCGDLCVSLKKNPPCTPPSCASNAWVDDVEPCLSECCEDECKDGSTAGCTRNDCWGELEEYMQCLDRFMEGPFLDYLELSNQCTNSSLNWQKKKEECDPSGGGVAKELCEAVDANENACTYYFTNWRMQYNTCERDRASARVIIENGFRQHEAMRQVECYWNAILVGDRNIGGDVATECAKCDEISKKPECNEKDWCQPDGLESGSCPDKFQAPSWCEGYPDQQPCNNMHECDVCTAKFRHEFHGCPVADWDNEETLCEIDESTGVMMDITDKENPKPVSDYCRLLVEQIGCTRFDCERQCAGLRTIPASGGAPFRTTYLGGEVGSYPARTAYEPFICGGDAIGNRDFIRDV